MEHGGHVVESAVERVKQKRRVVPRQQRGEPDFRHRVRALKDIQPVPLHILLSFGCALGDPGGVPAKHIHEFFRGKARLLGVEGLGVITVAEIGAGIGLYRLAERRGVLGRVVSAVDVFIGVVRVGIVPIDLRKFIAHTDQLQEDLSRLPVLAAAPIPFRSDSSL